MDMDMTSGKEWYKDGQCCDKLRLWMSDPKFADHSSTAPPSHPFLFISPIRKLRRVRPKDHRLWQARHNAEPTRPRTAENAHRPTRQNAKSRVEELGPIFLDAAF